MQKRGPVYTMILFKNWILLIQTIQFQSSFCHDIQLAKQVLKNVKKFIFLR